jgi:hypothetical protein
MQRSPLSPSLKAADVTNLRDGYGINRASVSMMSHEELYHFP